MERYVCLHCHFYQPPRENPWLEAIEHQDSAYPYHDWNERITAECYEPNSASRILGDDKRIERIVNNYSRISFNFGPTLLSWMEEKAPQVYRAVLEADQESRQRFSGHGSALAQAYNHMIMPLSTRRDKYTQALWGIRDFEHRFGRPPEGMWLPETAVDLETLDVLAELGIKFTLLAPHQAAGIRPLGDEGDFHHVGAHIDPTRPYLCRLPSGRQISLFFYDGPISRAVAFEGLLSNGEHFAGRLVSGFDEGRDWPQLMHIATDGETYGHHHRHGDMALAYALHHIESSNLARLTNYGEYLERHPPQMEAQIADNTSWSCVHGVERWRSDCGCNSGMKPGWHQQWRGPLRAALDWLRDELEHPYAEAAGQLLPDPWQARDEYIGVVLDRSPENMDRFLARQAGRELKEAEQVRALQLLEMQRHLMLMYTSCGWFFDELSGIETVQVIAYAGRAIQLGHELFRDHLEERFLQHMTAAPSNVPQHRDGAHIYEEFVRPARIDLRSVGAHYAISSLFHAAEGGATSSIYGYDVEREDYRLSQAGRARLALGHARVRSRITRDSLEVSFGVLHLGDHNLNAGVRKFRGHEAYGELVREAEQAFLAADMAGAIRLLDRHFDGITYSLRSIFRDEQRRVLREILRGIMEETEASYRQIYENHAPVLRFLADLGTPAPRVLRTTAEFVLNSSLRRAFSEDDLNIENIHTLLETVRREKVKLDDTGLSFVVEQRLVRLAAQLEARSFDLPLLDRFAAAIRMVVALPFEVDVWRVQNVFYRAIQNHYPAMKACQAEREECREWVRHFEALGELLNVGVEVREPSPAPAD